MDSFGNLSTGVDSGKSASMILPTCVSAASNIALRGTYAHTRPPWANIPINVPAALASRWAGIYQGSGYYDGWGAASGWIISRGGLIFFLDSTSFTLKEITVSGQINVTADFTVPAVNGLVNIAVDTESVFSVGQQLVIDSGHYTVASLAADLITVTYQGSAAHATVTKGTPVLDSSGNPVSFYDPNPATDDFVFIFQAENYGIVLAGKEIPLIWDGSNMRRAGDDELPPSILGAYGWGRIWLALPDQRSFIAGNLVGDQSSGTAQNGFRDAILKFTDNDFLNGGGTFNVPINAGKITTMQFLATQDTSFGVGVLLVGTTNMVFSVNAPVDRTTWQNLSYPIQTVSLIDYGTQGPRNSVSVNGDMWYRSVDGIRSFMVVQRYFGDPGNVPMSREMDPILADDTPNLLFWGSGIYFDNKLLETISPFRTAAGVQHRGLVSINYDLLSDLRQKDPPAWEGVHSGLSILQLTKGTINNNERGFMFVQGPTDVELWEIQRQGLHDTIGANKTRIASWLESRSLFSTSATLLKKLYMLELYLDDIADEVQVTIKFQPDQYPDWVLWGTLSFCATVSQCQLQVNSGQCQVFQANARQYAVRMLLPQPQEGLCNVIPGMPPLNLGYQFQVRLEWVGHVEVRLCQVHAKLVDQPMEGFCQGASACTAFPMCDTNYFQYSSHNGTVAIVPPSNIIPAGATYDSLGFFELTGVTPGTLYVIFPGFAEAVYGGTVTNGVLVYDFTSSFPSFEAQTDSLTFHIGQPNLPVNATMMPVTSLSNIIPAGSVYDGTDQFSIGVSPGAFYVVQLGGNEASMTNGPDIIFDQTLMSIQAKSNALVFSGQGNPQVGALVLPTAGVQQF